MMVQLMVHLRNAARPTRTPTACSWPSTLSMQQGTIMRQIGVLLRGLALASLCVVALLASTTWRVSEEMAAAPPPEPTRMGARRGADGTWILETYDGGGGGAYAAVAAYSPASAHASGFGELHVVGRGGGYSAEDRAFAAGALEGVLTAKKVGETAKNLACEVRCDGSVPAAISDFFDAQENWTDVGVAARGATDPLWRSVGLVRRQYAGLILGLARSPDGPDDPRWAARLINNLGDLFDVKPAVDAGTREDFASAPPAKASEALAREGRCSSLFTAADDLSEIYFSHASWFHYSNMNRVYKHYDLDGRRSSFSSYPGMLSSLDDFYLLHDSEIAVLQTTNGIYDASLYDAVTPLSLPAWLRIRAANALAVDGATWAAYYGRWNSGTYNNQYQILDLKRFSPGEALAPGTLTIVEQIPGLVLSGDATDELLRGYFPSYNVPYLPEIYARSGYNDLDRRRGNPPGFEYQQAPRAKIFRRDHRDAMSVDGIKAVMRSNGYRRGDPFAVNAWAAVCARGDLNEGRRSLAGCYDAKVSSASLFRNGGRAYVVNGPTNDGQPTFDWRKITVVSDLSNASGSPGERAVNGAGLNLDLSASHLGQPDRFDFTFEELRPTWAAIFPGPGVSNP